MWIPVSLRWVEVIIPSRFIYNCTIYAIETCHRGPNKIPI